MEIGRNRQAVPVSTSRLSVAEAEEGLVALEQLDQAAAEEVALWFGVYTMLMHCHPL